MRSVCLQSAFRAGILVTVAVWCSPALGMDEAALSALLEEARTEMKMPGLRAAVQLADGRLVRAAVGLGDVEAGIPLDNAIGMPGGSTGKTFVAALAMLPTSPSGPPRPHLGVPPEYPLREVPPPGELPPEYRKVDLSAG